MQKPPLLTDRTALTRNRKRAQSMPEPADFLHRHAIDDIQERLTFVNRRFTNVAIVTGWPSIWAQAFPDAHIIEDHDTLNLRPETHDLIIHAMAMHWANDPVGQLIQSRRALKPDGLFLGVLFGGQTLHELRAVLAESESHISGGLSPRIAPMAEIRDIGSLLQRAGFALPVTDSQTSMVSYRGIIHLMHDLRAMGEGNAMASRRRNFTSKAILDHAMTRYADAFGTDDKRITATFELIYLSGWAPDEGQPKPLRPGSATTRLADALGVSETELPLGD